MVKSMARRFTGGLGLTAKRDKKKKKSFLESVCVVTSTKCSCDGKGEHTYGVFGEDRFGWWAWVSGPHNVLSTDSELILAALQQLRHPVLHLRIDSLCVASNPPAGTKASCVSLRNLLSQCLWTVKIFYCVCCAPVGHGLLPLHDVACDWFSSISRWFPADEGGVVVNLLHYGLFGGIGHLCVGITHIDQRLRETSCVDITG